MLEIIKELFKFDNIPIMLIIGVIIGYTIKKIIHLDKQVTNHLPTQIKEVRTEIKDLSSKVDNNHNEINQRLDKMNERFDKMNQRFDKMNERFDKLYQILLDKK